jgi:hypothetical protein
MMLYTSASATVVWCRPNARKELFDHLARRDICRRSFSCQPFRRLGCLPACTDADGSWHCFGVHVSCSEDAEGLSNSGFDVPQIHLAIIREIYSNRAAILTFAFLWLAFIAHSGWIHYHESRGALAYQKIRIPDELALARVDPRDGSALGTAKDH